ncbi:COX assembly mitochondrial protein homolog isoform X1 [Trachypithecus francoisi]|uniref:COX assembly mitochondrial protein homolog isoform X1 n=1 Tax=Trachypithecus francoisi TaxID=54180 RepID=UPI00141BCC6D|nr:COX assembly mitochondrial protein homolog isoform X1 [Trachypithecus francoisi]
MALDPADQHLRHVEKDILIPKIMREKAKERCSEQVQGFLTEHVLNSLSSLFHFPPPKQNKFICYSFLVSVCLCTTVLLFVFLVFFKSSTQAIMHPARKLGVILDSSFYYTHK